MGGGHDRDKNTYLQIRKPFLPFDKNVMERFYKREKDSDRGVISSELWHSRYIPFHVGQRML